ncbi:hypothetical protein LCGC14_2530090 [marine sediment metagenome]|uniref:Uncharacterized protein n=1 Tax=marine sediment metagenome TaxID=412755 RepID=A0A0F9ATT4_9ZZZZ
MQNVMTIQEQDEIQLAAFIKKHQIKSVLEFGTGKSTKLFDGLCERVVSFDTDPNYQDNKKASSNTSLHLWQGVADEFMEHYCRGMKIDMVFIDGPAGGENREPSYYLAQITNCRFIACHDSQREYESRWINKYLKNWALVDSTSTLSIYENKVLEAKVLIAMPMPRDFKMDFEAMRFSASAMKKGWHWLNCPSVEPTLARNMLIAWFLTKKEFTDFTHLFFLDADTVPPPNAIERLLLHDKDVVCGLTPLWLRKTIYWNVQIEEERNLHVTKLPTGLTKVRRVGGTTILIKRHVLEKLKFPYFKIVFPDTIEQAIETGPMTQGSDYYFCDRITEAGFEIYADPTILCKHVKQVDLLDLAVEFKET